ncbi:MAG: nuclear transport factor 2 family protein [Acidimicrobiia bacterium]|nr:nuclear transport factor 2 family protein [Acidimicrobiia bacterium]
MTDSIDEAVRRLVDEREIVGLAVRYCLAVDARDYDALRDVFVADATACFAGRDEIGLEAIIGRCRDTLDPCDATQHLVSNHLVTLEGDTATAQCELQAQHVRRGGDGGSTFTLGGRYRDRVTRTPAGWRIAHRELEVVWIAGNPGVLGRPPGP